MSEFDRTNAGALSRNEDKTKPDAHAGWPDHKGSGDVKCPKCGGISQFWISAWVKTNSKTGGKFFSLAFKPKDAPPPQAGNEYAEAKGRVSGAFDDDIPF